MYCTNSSTLGRLYALCAAGVVCFVDVWSITNSSVGIRAKRHSFGSFFSLRPVRIGLTFGESTIKSCSVKTTVQSASHMVPTPTSVLVKEVMVYPVVGKSAANWGMDSIDFDDDFSTCPFAVPTLIVSALVLGGPCGAEGAMQRCVSPETTMPVSCCGRICPCGASGVGIYVSVGLQIKIASYNKGSLRGYLCTTVCAATYLHSLSLHATLFLSISFRAHSFRSIIFLGSK